MGVSRAAGRDCFNMFSSWPSHGSGDNFIFTHLSVWGVCQLSSSVLPVRRVLLFKVLYGWSLSATVEALLLLLGVDLGCRGCVPWFNGFFFFFCFLCFVSSVLVLLNDQGFLKRGRARTTYELGVSKWTWERKSLLQLDLLPLYPKYQKLHKFKLVSRNRPKSRDISQCGRMGCQQS